MISCIPDIRHARALALALVLSACGGGDGPGVVDPPPPPDNVAAKVEIVSPAESVQATQTLQLSATVRNAAGVVLSGKTLTWQSASNSVASVTATGLVTGNGPGRVTLTALETVSGRSGSMELSVLPAPVATLAIAPGALVVLEGASQHLSAVARDANGGVLTGRAVAWSSADAAVARVDSSGVVRGMRAGASTTITATAEGKSATAEVTVMPAPVASLTMEPASISLHPGGTRTLTITARDAAGNVLAGRPVTLVSSDASVATVSGGVVTAAGPGTATITATSEGRSASATVTVDLVPVASLTMEPASISLHPGGTRTLTITARDAAGNVLAGRPVTLVSSDASVATVSGGVVTAVGTGMATVEATSEGKTARSSVTVTPVPVASLAIEPSSISLHVGGTQALAITARDADGNVLPGRTVLLTTSHTWVAHVADGVVTAVGVGSTTITATVQGGGPTATAAVTVTLPPIASLAVEPASISLRVGGTQTLAVVARDAGGKVLTGRAVTLVSSDASVATVWGDVVTAAGVGSATITATAEGKTATASVGVTAVPVASVSIEPASLTLQAGEATTPQIFALDSAGNRLGRIVTLVSSDASVFAVEHGLVTGVGEGNATLTATSEGKSATASVTVTRALVALVSVNPGSMYLLEGARGLSPLTVTARDRWGRVLAGRTATLVSSDASVASLDGNLLTAVGPGNATITATCEGVIGTASVTVARDAVNYVTLSSSGFALKPGITRQLAATTWGSVAGHALTGRAVTWSSSMPGVATVDASGLVTGVADGTATITATSEGKSAQATVTVGAVARLEISPGFAVLDVGGSTTFQAKAFTAGGQLVPDQQPQWRLQSANGVATEDGSGTVTGTSAGQERIAATVDAARDTALIAVLGAKSLLSTAFARGEAKAYVRRGQTVVVPVMLDLSKASANGDLGAAQFRLEYDPAVLVYQSASAGVTGTADFNVPTPGTFRFSFAGTNPQGTSRLTLVTVTFTVHGGAPLDAPRALTLTYTAQPANTSFAKYALPIAVSGRVVVVP